MCRSQLTGKNLVNLGNIIDEFTSGAALDFLMIGEFDLEGIHEPFLQPAAQPVLFRRR